MHSRAVVDFVLTTHAIQQCHVFMCFPMFLFIHIPWGTLSLHSLRTCCIPQELGALDPLHIGGFSFWTFDCVRLAVSFTIMRRCVWKVASFSLVDIVIKCRVIQLFVISIILKVVSINSYYSNLMFIASINISFRYVSHIFTITSYCGWPGNKNP